MRKIVVLGGNKLHRGFEDLKKRIAIDEVIVIDWNEKPPYVGDSFIQCDIKDYEKIQSYDIEWSEVDFVYTSADIAVRTQIELHKKMGLLTPTQDAINNALVKGNSTRCWMENNILNKYSRVVEDINELEEIKFDKVIIKPNCSSGSRNITILEGKEICIGKLDEAIQLAKSESIDHKAIVEEFCEGTEYTIEMLGDNYGNVAVYGISKKYHTPYNTKNKIAVKLHYNPYDVEDEVLNALAEFGIACYKAIGLKNSFGHLEVIMMADGRIVPVEIGARSSGYIATHLLDGINKDSFLKKYSEIIRGGRVNNGIVFDRTLSSMYFFYDIRPGISKSQTNLMEYMNSEIISVQCDRENLIKNKQIRMLNADHERVGLEILVGKRCRLTIENVNAAEKQFLDNFMGD